jgi:hypothetical protein
LAAAIGRPTKAIAAVKNFLRVRGIEKFPTGTKSAQHHPDLADVGHNFSRHRGHLSMRRIVISGTAAFRAPRQYNLASSEPQSVLRHPFEDDGDALADATAHRH